MRQRVDARRRLATAAGSPRRRGDVGRRSAGESLRGLAEAVDVRQRTGTFEFASVEDGVAFWDRTNPPMAAFRSLLPDDVYQDVVVAGLARLFRELNRADDGRLALDWDYVEVLARAPA